MKEERTAMKKGLAIIISLMMATAFAAINIGSPMKVAAASIDDYDLEEDYGYEDYDEDVDEEYDDDYDMDYEEGADEEGADEEAAEEAQCFEVPGSSGSFSITEHTVYSSGSDSIVFDGVGLSANGGSVSLDLSSGSYGFYPAQEGSAFLGWNTSADGTGASFSPGESMDLSEAQSTGTLYADWEELSDDEESNEDNQDEFVGPVYEDDNNSNDQYTEEPAEEPADENDVTVPENDSNNEDNIVDNPVADEPVNEGEDNDKNRILPIPELPAPSDLIPDVPAPTDLLPDVPAPSDLLPDVPSIGDITDVSNVIRNFSFNFNQDNSQHHSYSFVDNSKYESFTNWLPWNADWYYPHWHKDPKCAPEEPVRTDTGETYTPDCGIVQTGDEDSWMIYLAAVMLFVSLAAGIAFIVLRRREKEQEMEEDYWMN